MDKVDTRSDTVEKEIFYSTDPQTRLAAFISKIANPLFVALPLFLAVALYTAPTLVQGFLWWVITILGMAAAPYLFILRGVRSGKITDHHVSDRRQRLVPLSFGLACMVSTFIILILLHASRGLLATATSVILILALCIVVTQKWKISLHAAGMAGAVTALAFVLGPLWILLGVLVLVIGWARWQVRAHTWLQTFGGALLAVVVTTLTFLLFSL